MSICVGTSVPAHISSSLQRTPGTRGRGDGGVRHFSQLQPGTLNPEPPPPSHPLLCSSEPAGPPWIHPLLTLAALRRECVVGGGVLVAADRGRAADWEEEEDGCAALAVQAGGIKEDRDQSPSAPSLRVPRPPDYKSVF